MEEHFQKNILFSRKVKLFLVKMTESSAWNDCLYSICPTQNSRSSKSLFQIKRNKLIKFSI